MTVHKVDEGVEIIFRFNEHEASVERFFFLLSVKIIWRSGKSLFLEVINRIREGKIE